MPFLPNLHLSKQDWAHRGIESNPSQSILVSNQYCIDTLFMAAKQVVPWVLLTSKQRLHFIYAPRAEKQLSTKPRDSGQMKQIFGLNTETETRPLGKAKILAKPKCWQKHFFRTKYRKQPLSAKK